MPRFTFVSDGKPRRRLRIGLKKGLVVEVVVEHAVHPTLPSWPFAEPSPEDRARLGGS